MLRRIVFLGPYLRKSLEGELFHFKGVYCGEIIKNIVIVNREGAELSKERVYLLAIDVLKIERNVLYGKVVKLKETSLFFS